MADLTAADPVAIFLPWLQGHPRIAADFGGPEHVSGLYEDPWPHLRVSTGPGGAFDSAMWSAQSEVTLEAVDHPANLVGKARLWQLLIGALYVVQALPDREVTAADPVVSLVNPSGMVGWVPLATGQGRWTIGVTVTVHPPLA